MDTDCPASDAPIGEKNTWRRANSDLRDLHNKNLEHIQQLIQRHKSQQEQEAQALDKEKRLHKQLARRVLGGSLGRPIRGDSGANSDGETAAAHTSTTRSSCIAARDSAAGSTESYLMSAGIVSSSRSQSGVPSLPPLLEAGGTGGGTSGGGSDDSPQATPRSSSLKLLGPCGTDRGDSSSGGRRRLRGGSGGDGGTRSSMGLKQTGRVAGQAGPMTDKSSAECSPKKPSARSSSDTACLALYQAGRQQQGDALLQRMRDVACASPQMQYAAWRLKHKLPTDQRVFCMAGSGNHTQGVRAGLLARGWFENVEHNSTNFDLKWAISPQDVNHGALWDGQIVNHFFRSTCITTKAGLTHTIRQLAWFEAADFRHFFPRAYDLSAPEEMQDFLQDARWTAAEALLKRALAEDSESSATTSVELSTLKLALRAVAARLAHDRLLIDFDDDHLSSSNSAAVSSEAQPLTDAEWATLLKHPALTASPPDQGPLSLDPTWLTSRKFICSNILPRIVTRRRRRKGRRATTGGSVGGSAAASAAAGGAGGAGDDDGSGDDASGSDSSDDGSRRGSRTLPKAATTAALKAAATAHKASSGGVSPRSPSARPGGAQRVEAPRSPPCLSRSSPHSAATAATSCRRDGSSTEGDSSSAAPSPPQSQPSGQQQQPLQRPGSALGVPLGGGQPEVDWAALQLLADAAQKCTAGSRGDLLAFGGALIAACGKLHPQTHINGMNAVWIVKPGGKSRGRGIRLFSSLDDMFAYIKGGEAQELESRWIAQKYVERPLIIMARKFDLRQWVLVTDWNPLAVWFYGDCYLRFAADDYDMNNLDIYQHLCNNSVSKYFDGPAKADSITAGGNMWSTQQFKEWLHQTYGDAGLWESLIQPAMKHIVICTLKSAQDMVKARKNSCQIYGYDFLIDDQLRVWMLEINSSPTMEASTPVTTRLCADVQDDILKVIIDLPAHRQQALRDGGSGGGGLSEGGAASAVSSSSPTTPATATTSTCDTGKFECIVDGGHELRTPPFIGLSLELRGTPCSIKAPPGGTTKSTTGGTGFGGGTRRLGPTQATTSGPAASDGGESLKPAPAAERLMRASGEGTSSGVPNRLMAKISGTVSSAIGGAAAPQTTTASVGLSKSGVGHSRPDHGDAHVGGTGGGGNCGSTVHDRGVPHARRVPRDISPPRRPALDAPATVASVVAASCSAGLSRHPATYRLDDATTTGGGDGDGGDHHSPSTSYIDLSCGISGTAFGGGSSGGGGGGTSGGSTSPSALFPERTAQPLQPPPQWASSGALLRTSISFKNKPVLTLRQSWGGANVSSINSLGSVAGVPVAGHEQQATSALSRLYVGGINMDSGRASAMLRQ